MNERIDEILEYWFGPTPEGQKRPSGEELWFGDGAAMDRDIRRQFGPLVERAKAGELDSWSATPRGRLALILLLDQFNRRLHRERPEAFSGDEKALQLCFDGLDDGVDQKLRPIERCFFYLPAMHAEDTDAQLASVEIYQELLEAAPPGDQPLCRAFLRRAETSRDIVERFERFPDRNAILNRSSTPEESTFLQHSGSL